TKGATLSVNGDAKKEVRPGAYAELHRQWKAGDVVELQLPMAPVLVQAHPLAEELRNQVAVKRGPLVYCLESTDLPKKTSLLAAALPRTMSFQSKTDRSLGTEMTVLQCKIEIAEESPWGEQLYREVQPKAPRNVDAQLIPYFAWGNRR